MSFLDRLREKMTGSLAKKVRLKPAEKSRHTLVTNRWDERAWAGVREIEQVDKLIYDLSIGDEHEGGTRKGFEPAPELVHDLFMAFFKAAPELVDKRDLDRDVYIVHKMVAEMLDNPKLTDFQEMTAGQEMETLVALIALADTVRDILGRVPPPPPPPQPKQLGGQGDGEPTQGDGEPGEPGEPGDASDDGEPGDGDAEEDGNGDSDAETEAHDAEEADWQAAYDALLDDLDLERAMIRGVDSAGDEVDGLDKLRRGAGLEDGEWNLMSPTERLKMADLLRTPKMKLFAQIVGRMKRFALGVKATRITGVPHETFDVEYGDDMHKTLHSEFALLATPQTSLEFYRRFVDRELLQYKMRGTEDVGRGPIVVCIDKSYSMSGAPFLWAMAVAEALRRFASEEDRDYFAYFFGKNNDRHSFDFPKGKGPFEKVLAFLSVEANGGTEFSGVLDEALSKASTAFDGEAKGKADVVFITDGEAKLSPSWITAFNAERARTGVRVYSVLITGADDIGALIPATVLDQVSDIVIPVRDLEPESARRIFASV